MRSGSRTARAALTGALAVTLAQPAAASASGGEGLLGPVTDYDITMAFFVVIALFIVLPIVLSLIQHRLDTRKERMREQLERVHRP
jgi:uncharacterized membrane protein